MPYGQSRDHGAESGNFRHTNSRVVKPQLPKLTQTAEMSKAGFGDVVRRQVEVAQFAKARQMRQAGVGNAAIPREVQRAKFLHTVQAEHSRIIDVRVAEMQLLELGEACQTCHRGVRHRTELQVLEVR